MERGEMDFSSISSSSSDRLDKYDNFMAKKNKIFRP